MKTIIGIMGPSDNCAAIDMDNAYKFAKLVAKKNWVVLTGGRPVGVMKAAHEGAKAAAKKGLVVGILPSTNSKGGACELVDIPIYTGLGDARNAITGQSPDVVVAFVEDAGPGTVSEIALACKAERPIVLVGTHETTARIAGVFQSARLLQAQDVAAAMTSVEALLEGDEPCA